MKRLDGKTIIIVGASGGIGSVLAREFNKEGANLILSARNKEKLDAVKRSLPNKHSAVIPTDASSMQEVNALFQKAKRKFGRIDAVITSVGTWDRLTFSDNLKKAEEMFDRHYKSILKPAFDIAFTAQQYFRRQKSGLIVNISSHAAVRPYLKGNDSYGPMNAAKRQLILCLAAELADTEVRFCDIQPATVNTIENRKFLKSEEKRRAAVQPEAIAEWIIQNFNNFDIPLEKLFDSSVKLE